MEDLSIWLELVGNLGIVGLLALAVYAGIRGWVIPAPFLRQIIAYVVEEVLDQLEQRGKL